MSDSRGQASRFDTAGKEFIKAQLPNLSFVPAVDASWTSNPPVQTYLDFYAINFARTRAGVIHGFGAIDACGFRIATHYWVPENPKGTLVVVHGYYDHVGLFGHAIEFGLQQGWAVLAFDLPGHGLSSGEQVVIDAFDHYADVLDVVLSAARRLLPAPFFSMGQSTGGSVLLNYLWRYDRPRSEPVFSRIALCAPLILPRGWRYSGRFLYALVHAFVQRMPRGRSHSSHDQEFNRFVDEQDCLQSRTLSVRWVGAMKVWDQQFRRFSVLPDKSVLVVQGTGDQTVAWRYNLQQIQRALPNARIELIRDAGHQLVNESSDLRAQVFTAINRHFQGD